MSVNYRFILGLARSGTTFLSRLTGLTSSPAKTLEEPLVGVKQKREKGKVEASYCNPFDQEEIASFTDIIEKLHTDYYFSESVTKRIERNDPGNNMLLIKEVHSLLTFPEYTKQLNAKVVVITRDIDRVMDSFFYCFTKNKRSYLVEEYNFIKKYLNNEFPDKIELLDMAINNTSSRVVKYFKRPKFTVSELIRQSCISEVMTNFLVAWSIKEQNVLRVEFEKLCVQPLEETRKVFDFLGLEYDSSIERDVLQMTTGKQDSCHDTKKTSIAVLEQKYKILNDKQVYSIGRLQKK